MKRINVTAALAATIVGLGVPAASAAEFAGSRTGARVGGDLSITSTRVTISGRVWDTRADGHCGRLRGNWDIWLAPDHGFTVAEACGNGTDSSGFAQDNVDRGARDFEVRVNVGDNYKVVWEGNNGDA